MGNYEVVIIGGSYAGLSAAMALGRSRRKVLIVDAGDPCNKSTPQSHNFLTQDGIPPAEIASVGREQVLNYPTIHWHSGQVYDVMGEEGSFEIAIENGGVVMAQRIILATGLKDELPEIPGFKACWGKTVIHCPYCHGYEFKDMKTGILVNADQAFEMVNMINHWTGDLTLFLGDSKSLEEEHANRILDKGIRIVQQPIQEVIHDEGKLVHLVMEDKSIEPLTALYARLPTKQKVSFLNVLGCDTTETDHIEVDMFGKTSVEGIYAVGDCAHPMRSVATAVYTGNMAGAMLNKELIEMEA